jgi:linoleoyl-CoA desaturase
MKESNHISFATDNREFTATLNKRVNDYFKINHIKRQANGEMVLKTIFMFALYFVPYALIISETVTGVTGLILLTVVMSLGVAGIGLSVMHDANHGAYSKKPWINNVIGYSLNLIGANAFNWKMQHNVMHHTYTNIHDEDEDISPRGILRLTPHSDWKQIHRFQFIYAWFLYGLMTLVWIVIKDFVRIVRYDRNGMAQKHKANIAREWIILIGGKLLFIGYIFIIPLVLTSLSWWQILLGIILMHYIAGFILTIIFQPAHVTESTEFPLPDESNNLKNNWAIHQLYTTSNFSQNSRIFSWYVGGLNYQIEHHLFPNICHIHYRKIAEIVKTTATEFGLPYKTVKTFIGALKSHFKLLRKLGMKPA